MPDLWVKGSLLVTLNHLDKKERNETKSVVFQRGDRIPEIEFSRKEKFNFSLKVKEEEGRNLITGVTERSRQAELTFLGYRSDGQRPVYHGV